MKNLKNFVKRNLPIFVIGFVTMLVFVGIILLSEKNDPGEPALKIVNQDELVAEHNYFKGPEDAKVVLVEFSDFQCPACVLFQPLIKNFEIKYPNLKVIYKHYPLPQHPKAKSAAYASMAAGEQDAFWEYHDKLFENQNSLGTELYYQIAKDLGLDQNKFKDDMVSEKIKQYVEADIKTGESLSVNSTPTFFLNGKLLQLNDIADLEKAIIEEFNKQNQTVGVKKNVTDEEDETEEELRDLSKKIAALDYGDTLDKPTYAIKITKDGFTPYEADIRQGQKIIWTNETEKDITIIPRVGYEEIYPAVKNGILVPAGGTAEFEINKPDIWVYLAKELDRFGYIYPMQLDGPIIPVTNESTTSE